MPTAASASGMIFAPITEVNSGADRENNDVYDKPEFVPAVSFDLFVAVFALSPARALCEFRVAYQVPQPFRPS